MVTTQIVTNHGFTVAIGTGINPGNLIEWTLSEHYTHLWVMPGSGRLVSEDFDSDTYDIRLWKDKKGHVASMTGRRLSPRTRNVNVIFLDYSLWKLPTQIDELRSLILKIEEKLGVAVSGSPTSVGLRYLEKVDARYYARYFRKDEETDYEQFQDINVPPIAWFPAPCTDFLDRGWLHCYDRNASHPYAASQLSFGIGLPTYEEGGQFHPLLPGFWDVDLIERPENIWMGLRMSELPPLLPDEREWLPTSLVKMLVNRGIEIEVKRAFYWTNKAPIFERWAKQLYGFRRAAESEAEDRAYKQIMNHPIGSLRHGADMDITFRPDWYDLVVGEERAVVWYKAWKRLNETNLPPVGCYADALYYASQSPEPGQGDMTGMLDHQTSLGGYKHVWTLRIDEEVRAILTARELEARPWDKIGELKKIVRRQANV